VPTYDATVALIVVDLQNDFADPAGSLYVRGAEVVRKGVDGGDGYSGFSVRHPVTGETNPTPLVELLRARGIERLVVCGLATDYCVVETVVDARMLGYPVTVILEGIRAVDLAEGDGEKAITRMRDAGAEVG